MHATTVAVRELEPGFDPYADTSGIFGSIAKAAKGAAKGVASVAKSGASVVNKGANAVGSAVKTTQGVLGKVPVVGKGLVALTTITMSPYEVALNIASGQRIDRAVINHFKNQLQAARDIAPYVQTVISFVPGVGAGVSGAIAAAVTLSEGKPITAALIAATKNALPGGPLAAAAFDAAIAATQGKPIPDIALAALPLPDSQKDLLKQSLTVAKDIAAGRRVDKIILDRVNANLSKLPKGIAQAAQIGIALGQGQNIQKTLTKTAINTIGENVNPFSAVKSITRIAEGASKGGITRAIGAAQALANKSPVLVTKLVEVGNKFPSGSLERHGFNTAVSVLKNTQGNVKALQVARNSLPSESARRAFDTAVGVMSETVRANPEALAKRAGSIFNPQLNRPRSQLSPFHPNLKHAIETLKRDPTLATQNPMVLANKFGTTQQTVLEALRHVQSERLLPWRSLSPAAARYVQQYSRFSPMNALTHGTNDTAGLDETGTKYVVVKGDSPFKIALQLTGNGNRWPELKAVNGDKKPAIDKNVWVGEVLNLPASWQKPTAKPVSPGTATASKPTPAAPSGPLSTPASAISVVPGTLQAKGILVAWGKTDGANEAGVSDYGSNPADLSTDFGPRDKLQLKSFQNWSNKPGNNAPDLKVDGILGPKSLSALQSWAESRASAATSTIPVVTPSSGGVLTLPETVIVASPPSIPAASSPVVSSPGLPQATAPIAVQTPSNPTPPVPAVAPPAPAQSGSKMGPVIAGAAAGGVLFGLPGAIIGGIAGAAIA